LSYFKSAFWEDEWITTAGWLIRDEFANSYMNNMNIEADNNINIVETTPDKEKETKVHILIILLWLIHSIIYQGYQHV